MKKYSKAREAPSEPDSEPTKTPRPDTSEFYGKYRYVMSNTDTFLLEAAESATELVELLRKNDWDIRDINYIFKPGRTIAIQVTTVARLERGDADEKEN